MVMEAAVGNDFISVELFLKAGMDPHEKNHVGQTALMFATKKGTECLKLLLEAGADINAVDKCCRSTALGWASRNGNLPALKALIETGADMNAGSSPLIGAADKKHVDCLRALVEAGVPPCAQALWYACMSGHEEAVRILLAQDGVKVDAHHLDAALKHPTSVVPELLIEHGVDAGKLLFNAAYNNNILLIEKLLKLGADPNSRDYKKETPIFNATRGNQLKALRRLIDAGASVNARDQSGATPLSAAICGQNMKTVEFLLEEGAGVNWCRTALQRAIRTYNLDLVELLITAGMRVNDRDENGFTALQTLMKKPHGPYEDTVTTLYKAGASLLDADGQTVVTPPPFLDGITRPWNLRLFALQAIRQGLLEANPDSNLIHLVPKLQGELPPALLNELLPSKEERAKKPRRPRYIPVCSDPMYYF